MGWEFDLSEDLTTWQSLANEKMQPLIELVKNTEDVDDIKSVTRFRKLGDRNQVRLAIELVRARRKAKLKFGLSDQLWVDTLGVEQSTDRIVAAHKATRYAESGFSHVADLCCGIGGDAMSLAGELELTGYDLDDSKCWMMQQNVKSVTGKQVNAVNGQVEQASLTGDVFHFDPDRRSEDRQRRSWNIEDYRPGPHFWRKLFQQIPHGAIKLGPGVKLDALPPGEVEFFTHRKSLVQATLWMGDLRRDERTATNLDQGLSIAGTPGNMPVREPGDFVYSIDSALLRSGLAHLVCDESLGEAYPDLGILTSDEARSNPWLKCYRIEQRMAYRKDKVKGWLFANDTGLTVVKTRGVKEPTDQLQMAWRGKGSIPWVVFIVKVGVKVEAWIGRVVD